MEVVEDTVEAVEEVVDMRIVVALAATVVGDTAVVAEVEVDHHMRTVEAVEATVEAEVEDMIAVGINFLRARQEHSPKERSGHPLMSHIC